MGKFIDAALFKLHPSTKLFEIDEKHFEIVIKRKSRLIMKDGRGILAKVNIIKSKVDAAEINLRTSTPVCSKTKLFLEEHGIKLLTCE